MTRGPLDGAQCDGRDEHELVVATRNRGKVSELRDLLAPSGFRLVSLDDAGIAPAAEEDAVETGETFEENALAKAQYFVSRAAGRAVIADDSGLCVRALGGAPGVRSRRYAGAAGSEAEVSAANSAKLLDELASCTDRAAEFVCAVAFVSPWGDAHVCSGRTAGRILAAPLGTNGFGYDPLFWSDVLGRSFGEASDADKARVSHRARAVTALLARPPLTRLAARSTLRDVRGVA